MSRIGRQPVTVPAGVEVEISPASVTVKNQTGTLSQPILAGTKLAKDGDMVAVSRKSDTPEAIRNFGLMRTMVSNMVQGLTDGFEKKLEINGVGYRAAIAGNTINLTLGFSHPIIYDLPEGISAKVEKNILTISGYDKQLVGQVAANIRALKKPEPYKGKGIKYSGEVIRRKAGKAATKG